MFLAREFLVDCFPFNGELFVIIRVSACMQEFSKIVFFASFSPWPGLISLGSCIAQGLIIS